MLRQWLNLKIFKPGSALGGRRRTALLRWLWHRHTWYWPGVCTRTVNWRFRWGPSPLSGWASDTAWWMAPRAALESFRTDSWLLVLASRCPTMRTLCS